MTDVVFGTWLLIGLTSDLSLECLGVQSRSDFSEDLTIGSLFSSSRRTSYVKYFESWAVMYCLEMLFCFDKASTRSLICCFKKISVLQCSS